MTHPRSRFMPQLEAAATELHRAADVATLRSDDNPFSHWAALAGQLRLIASGLSSLCQASESSPDGSVRGDGDLVGHLSTASAALDEISPADAPEDLAFWAGHIDDLKTLTEDLGLTSDGHGSRS